ncbi:MAG: lipopolysaccharide biosynthesis protein, partial [Sphingobium sp.]
MTTHAQEPEEGLGIYPGELLAMLYRRRYWLIPPILLGLIGAIVLIALQTPMYKSSATLLIDTQSIPTTVIASPLTSIANERIGKIGQQIKSRDSLTALITRHGLYREERETRPMSEILDMMRWSIDGQLVGADPGTSGQGNTIAFTLSFTYKDAQLAHAVTSDLTRMFQVEDKRFRTTQATGAAAFLGRRAEELHRQLSALEAKRRGIEARYAGALPDQVALNSQASAALRAELSRIDSETQGLGQQNSLLAARANENASAPPAGADALRRAEERLHLLSATYSDNYPDLVAQRLTVERQRAALDRTEPARGAAVIEQELAASHVRIGTLAHRRSQLVSTIADMEHRTAQAPQASYELNMLERDYDNMKRQYESLREKELDANVAANLQSEDKGERFSVVDEPSMPHESLQPRPLYVMLAGLLSGAAAGVVGIIGYELLRGSIHGENALTQTMGAAPMGVIPTLESQEKPAWLHGIFA